AKQPLAERRARRSLHHGSVEEEYAHELHLEVGLQVARHQLSGHGGAHVVGNEENGAVMPSDQILDEVRLPMEGVAMVAWLLGEPKAEKVRGESGMLGLLVHEEPPVIGARGEAMQVEQPRVPAGAVEQMDPSASEFLLPPALPPCLNAIGEHHPRTSI